MKFISGEVGIKGSTKVALVAFGLLAILLVSLFPPIASLSWKANVVLGVALTMAVWWATEALPIPATSMVPLALFPSIDIVPLKTVAASYGHPLIFLFLGGFVLALALERWHLHRRIALSILSFSGTDPKSLIAGFMVASALISMWVTNTATTLMMLPICVSVFDTIREKKQDAQNSELLRFGKLLILSVAYASTIGGLATLVGTVPNAYVASFLNERYGMTIGFIEWIQYGFPVVVVLLPLSWYLLTRWALPFDIGSTSLSKHVIKEDLKLMGSLSKGEKLLLVVFSVTALSWIFRPLLNNVLPAPISLSDTGIAIICAVSLFAIPVDVKNGIFLMDWDWAKRLPWDVLLLFGGGLSLAAAIETSGLSQWIGTTLSGIGMLPMIMIAGVLILAIIILTELTSNTATTATFLPVVAALADDLGGAPLQLLVPVGLAASCAFMFPVATPPNAIVYGSGYISIKDMIRAGVYLNTAAALVLWALAWSIPYLH